MSRVEAMRQERQRRASVGLCREIGCKEKVTGRARCEYHAQRQVEAVKRYARKRRNDHECLDCGIALVGSDREYVRCGRCREVRARETLTYIDKRVQRDRRFLIAHRAKSRAYAMRQWTFWTVSFLDQEDVDWVDDVLTFCPEPRLPEADEPGADWRGLAIMDGCGFYRMRGEP